MPSKNLKYPRISNSFKAIPSNDELKALLNKPEKGSRDWIVLNLLFQTGMRAGELANLTIERIDLNKRSILVKGKGGHERVVYFNSDLALELKRFIDGKYGSLFELTSHDISDVVSKYCKKLGLPYSGAHTLRRACATSLFERGCQLREIQDYLGHKTIKTTFQYVNPRIDYLREMHLKYHPFQKGFL